MKTALLITVNSTVEAHLIKGKLNNNGIECMLTNEHISTLLPHYNNMLNGGIRIFVSEDNFEKARQIISDEIQPESVKECPYCHSQNIGIGYSKYKIVRILYILVALLFLIPFANFKPRHYCKDCKRDF